MHTSLFLLAGSAFVNMAMAAPAPAPVSTLNKRLVLTDCESSPERAAKLQQAMRGCVAAANAAADEIENNVQPAIAYFNTDDQATRLDIARKYREIANECAGNGMVTMSCQNVDDVECGGGTLAVTHWETRNGEITRSNIFFCPNSWDTPSEQSDCGRDDMVTTLIHEMSHALFQTDDLFSFQQGPSADNCANDAYSFGYGARGMALKCLDSGNDFGVGVVNERFGSSKGSPIGNPRNDNSESNRNAPETPAPVPVDPQPIETVPQQPPTPSPAPIPAPAPAPVRNPVDNDQQGGNGRYGNGGNSSRRGRGGRGRGRRHRKHRNGGNRQSGNNGSDGSASTSPGKKPCDKSAKA